MTIICAPLEDMTLWQRGALTTSTGFFEIFADSLGIVRVNIDPKGRGRRTGGEGYAGMAVEALESYFAGSQLPGNIPIHIADTMTHFSLQTLKACSAIPFGKTMTYGELARKMNRPRAARAVGQALGSNPVPLFIPCHRVVGAGGLGGYTGGLGIKRFLLNVEGIS